MPRVHSQVRHRSRTQCSLSYTTISILVLCCSVVIGLASVAKMYGFRRFLDVAIPLVTLGAAVALRFSHHDTRASSPFMERFKKGYARVTVLPTIPEEGAASPSSRKATSDRAAKPAGAAAQSSSPKYHAGHPQGSMFPSALAPLAARDASGFDTEVPASPDAAWAGDAGSFDFGFGVGTGAGFGAATSSASGGSHAAHHRDRSDSILEFLGAWQDDDCCSVVTEASVAADSDDRDAEQASSSSPTEEPPSADFSVHVLSGRAWGAVSPANAGRMDTTTRTPPPPRRQSAPPVTVVASSAATASRRRHSVPLLRRSAAAANAPAAPLLRPASPPTLLLPRDTPSRAPAPRAHLH